MIRFLGASEYPTWIALPFAGLLLFRSVRPAAHLSGTLLLATSAITRTNQLPGAALLLGAFGLGGGPHRRRQLWIHAFLFAMVILLPIAHNVHYGGRAVLMPTSGDYDGNIVLGPSDYAAALRGSADGAVWRHLRQLVGLDIQSHLLRLGILGLQVAWVSSALVLWRLCGSASLVVLWFVPLGYLGVHLFYQVGAYYPRHIIAGHLAMGIVATLLISAMEGSRRPTAIAPAAAARYPAPP